MVLQLDRKHDGFSPKALGELCVVHHHTHAFEESAVERLRHAIMLRRVMHRKSALGALFLQELRKVATGVFSTMVGPEAFDFDAVLCFGPRSESLVSL